MDSQQEQNLVQKVTDVKDQATTVDFNKIIYILLSRWYIIISTVLISLLFTNLILRYSKPIYVTSGTMKLEDEKPNQLNDIFKFGKTTGKLDNFLRTEIQILKSRSFASKILKSLDYQITYMLEGNIVTKELYPNTHFEIKLLHLDSNIIGQSFVIKFFNNHRFEVGSLAKNSKKEVHNVQDTFFFKGAILKVTSLSNHYIGVPVIFTINDIEDLAGSFAGALDIEIEKGTSILNIRFTSENPQLAADYINTACKVYIDESIQSKSQAAQQTINFINVQLLDLSDKVKNSQNDLTTFKTQNSGVELDDIGSKELTKLTKFESESSVLKLKLKLLEQLENNVKDAKNKTLDFMTFDSDDLQALPELFAILNELLLERISLSSKYSTQSPIYIANERKLNEIKSSIIKSISTIKQKLIEKIDYNQNLINETNDQLSLLPLKQQVLINIQREYKVNEKVYSYLMEKKLETMIGKSSIVSNASVVDPALISTSPISPKRSKSYLVAFIIGLVSGITFIILLRSLYQKIPDKETIESMSRTPVIGVIKKIESTNQDNDYEIQIFKGPKSVFSEAIRGIRTNMNFILGGSKNKSICVTSTVSGEGKTFCTINLAASLTLLNKKVIVVGCDLRRPKLHLSFKGLSNETGLSTFLIGKSSYEDIIFDTGIENLYILPAGPPPPNPGELLQTIEMKNLMSKLKTNFDYVFYDTAPVGLVSDSFPLMKNVDLNLYILRSQYSKLDFARIPDRLRTDNDMNNIYSILNSYDNSSIFYSSIYKTEYGGYYGGGGYYYYGGYYGSSSYGAYGNKYANSYYSGYYTEEETKKPWWKFWNKKKGKNK